VTINNPRGGAYYGGSVAGPVSKEMAERIFAARNLFEDVTDEPEIAEDLVFPKIRKGTSESILQVANDLKIENVSGTAAPVVALVKQESDRLILDEIEFKEGKVPDVLGMGASDAI